MESIIGSSGLRASLEGVSDEQKMWLSARLEPITLHALHTLFIVAEPASAVYFLVRGTLSVLQGGVVRGCLSGRACCFGGKAFHDGAVHGELQQDLLNSPPRRAERDCRDTACTDGSLPRLPRRPGVRGDAFRAGGAGRDRGRPPDG